MLGRAVRLRRRPPRNRSPAWWPTARAALRPGRDARGSTRRRRAAAPRSSSASRSASSTKRLVAIVGCGGGRRRIELGPLGAHDEARLRGRLLQHVAQPAHGPQVAHAGGGIGELECLGDFAIRTAARSAASGSLRGRSRRADSMAARKPLLQLVVRGRGGGRHLRGRPTGRPGQTRCGRRRPAARASARGRCCAARPRGACGGRRSADRGPDAAARDETACRSFPGSRSSRRLASTSTSCTMSLASSRRPSTGSIRIATIRRSASRWRSSNCIARRRIARPGRVEQFLRFRGVGPHACSV